MTSPVDYCLTILKNQSSLQILFGLEFAHAISQLRKALEPSDADVRFADLPSTEMEPASRSSQDGVSGSIEAPSRADPKTAQEAPAQVQVTRYETRGDSGQGDESVKESSATWSNGSITGSMGEKLSSSEPEVLIQNESTPPGDAAAERVRSSTGAESSDASEEFRSGGLTWRLKRTEKMTDVVVTWVGGEGRALTDVMLTHNQCEVVQYDPGEKRLLTDVADNSRFLRRRSVRRVSIVRLLKLCLLSKVEGNCTGYRRFFYCLLFAASEKWTSRGPKGFVHQVLRSVCISS
jgi:hypothetical protein